MELYPSWGQGITSQLQGRAYINWRGTSRHISTQRDRPTILPARQLKPSIEFIPWNQLNFFTLAKNMEKDNFPSRLQGDHTSCIKLAGLRIAAKSIHLVAIPRSTYISVSVFELWTRCSALTCSSWWPRSCWPWGPMSVGRGGERARMLGTITTWSNLREREGIFVPYWGSSFFLTFCVTALQE